MTHSLVTIIAPLAIERVPATRDLIDKLGNPARDEVRNAIAGPTGDGFVHFASLHAIAGSEGKSGYVVLEFSADGAADAAIERLAARAGAFFEPIFQQCSNWPGGNLAAYWRSRQVTPGYGLFSDPGALFAGTPGQSVGAIEQEHALAARLKAILADQDASVSALARVENARRQLAADGPRWQWALGTPPPPINAPLKELSLLEQVIKLAPSFIGVFLWPLLLVLVPLAFYLAWPEQGCPCEFRPLLFYVLRAIGIILGGTLAVAATVYISLRSAEETDWISDRSPSPAEYEAMFARENAPGYVQNHMVALTPIKPSVVRQLTVRMAFWAVAKLAPLSPLPGRLNGIGTIHFARWVTIPGTRDLLFFSNYGGSWESYLEDFITKAHQGLTGVWSNTVGFPKSTNLIQGGATDGERFKRYARQSMFRTPFWYCAYRSLTTDNIRNNSLIRRGLATVLTEDEAMHWLALFGSASRPPSKLDIQGIQKIVFGGLGSNPFGEVVTVNLGSDPHSNREWLGAILPHVKFSDGRFEGLDAIITFGASCQGLAKLGLPQSCLDTFPFAFRSGMTGAGRDRILGDTGANAREHWWWGKDGVDIALLVYGKKAGDVAGLVERIAGFCTRHSCVMVNRIPLAEVKKNPADRKEPFGFLDGISQPAIRGTYRALRDPNPLHVMEPGEFILGYEDNRRNIPPGPLLDAGYDPDSRLPVAASDRGFGNATAASPRLPGFNGSFLVIRQLEQDVEGFHRYCEEEAKHIKHLFPEPAAVSADFVAAKLIGRWQNGSSLVRNPDRPARDEFRPDNDFQFGAEDPQGLACPFGAHIRRSNPRESFSPGSKQQLEITSRHRLLRIGRGYVQQPGQKPGLMFMCLNGDIERQFEFVQQTWMNSPKFHGLDSDGDPVAAHGEEGASGFTIPTPGGPVCLHAMPQFVRMRGGGYFFLPGRQLLEYLTC